MAVINLSVLTLVKSEKAERSSIFRLRPLFLLNPSVAAPRFESGVEIFQRDLRSIFSAWTLNKDNEDLLFWLMFQPEVKLEKLYLNIRSGKTLIAGAFSVIHFMAGPHTFLLFPDINNFMCMAEPDERGRVNIVAQAEKTLSALFRQYQKEQGDAFEPEVYFAPKRIYVTTIDIRADIREGGFSFEQKDFFSLFMQMNETPDFNGAEELFKTGHDLNQLFPGGLKRAWYREEWVELLQQRILSPEHVPIALVGPSGVGKHTLIEEVVFRYLNRHAGLNRSISPKMVWHLDPVRVITGMSIVGMWQKRFEAILRHIAAKDKWSDKPDILLVDNPLALLRIGRYSGGNMALSDVLKPHLEKRNFTFVLIATPEEWGIMEDQDRRFSSLFQVLRIEEGTRQDNTRILLQKAKQLEREHGTAFHVQAIDQMLHIHRNYLSNQALPGGVAKMMQQLAVKYRYTGVDAPEVRAEFQLASGLAEVFLDDSQTLETEEVEAALAGMLVGQPEALHALASVVHLVKSKLADKTKPVSSLLFAGPTGVGKTQAAKALCQVLTGSETALMRFDMNEYVDANAVARLIGDFYNPEGRLTSTVRHNPFGVLLLDEVEKAHPLVHDLLLQVLDDGRLSDSAGRTVDFCNVVIIMTSNLGAKEAASVIGFGAGEEDIRTVYIREVEKAFRPEFVNRIDHIIAFRSLQEEHIYDIARLQLRELLQRDGFVRRTSILNVDQNALRWVAKRGYDAKMGGRALKRQIEKDLTELSAEQLLAVPEATSIILDIFLDEGRLKPRIKAIHTLEPLPEEAMPQIPDEAAGKPFLLALQRKAEAYKLRLDAAKKKQKTAQHISETDIALYDLQERLENLKERINHLILSYKGKFIAHQPVIPLRYKVGKRHTSWGNTIPTEDKILRDEAIQEFREAYRYSLPQFSSLDSLFLEIYLDTAILQLFVEGFAKGIKDKVEIRISSLVSGMGRSDIDYLLDCYEAFLRHMDLPVRVRKNSGKIETEGFGLYALLAGETGIHLFSSTFGNSLPILVRVFPAGSPEEPQPPLHVLRLYDNNKLLTDIRTRFTCDIQITPQELKLLLHAGVIANGRLPVNRDFPH